MAFVSLAGLISPFVCFVIHTLIYRAIPRSKNWPRQKLVVMIILGVSAWEAVDFGIHAGVLSVLFGYTYFHWFNMSETARRIRLLVGHLQGQNNRYVTEKIFSNRIQRLIENGSLEREGAGFKLHRGPLVWATHLILFSRRAFFPAVKVTPIEESAISASPLEEPEPVVVQDFK